MDEHRNGSRFIPPATNGIPFDPWHSTPVKKKPTDEASIAVRTARSLHSPPNHHSSFSVMQTTQTQASDLEITTIQKQRLELQLLIAELKDRDQELNSMAAAHQSQIQAWEQDRQRVLSLEQRCARLEDELQKRNDVIRIISKRLKTAELSEKDSHRELSSIQQQLQELSQRQQHSSQKHQEIEEKNQSLNSTILSLSSQVGQLQVHEEELNSMLKLKDKDLTEATNQILALTDRLRGSENSLMDSQERESKTFREMEEYKRRFREARHENARLKGDLQEKTLESNTQREELIRLKQENQILRKELALADEGESWKDELIALARSKQERTESELLCLRQVCENQQNDLQLLKLNLESTRESLRQCEGQKTLERIDNVSGARVLERSTHHGTHLGESIECQCKSVDLPPQHHLEQSEKLSVADLTSSPNTLPEQAFTCVGLEEKTNSTTEGPPSEPGSALSRCCECSRDPAENQEADEGNAEPEVDFIAIINHGAGKEDSVLLVDVTPKDLQNACPGNVTCVYVDCATPSPRRRTSPGFLEDSFHNSANNSQQEEFVSSTSRLHRLLAESQQMVASLELSSGKLQLTSTSNRTPSPVPSSASQCESMCSLSDAHSNSDSREPTRSAKHGHEGQQGMEDREGECEIQNSSSF